jgi:hypothetical protein
MRAISPYGFPCRRVATRSTQQLRQAFYSSNYRAKTRLLWHTEAIMLIEIWERLRGYDGWIEAEATIKSSKTEIVVRRKRKGQLVYGWDGNKEIAWVDQSGVHRHGHLTVKEGPLIFTRHDGNSIVIRYNPASPLDFYVREQLRYQVNIGVRLALGAIFAIGLFGVVARN